MVEVTSGHYLRLENFPNICDLLKGTQRWSFHGKLILVRILLKMKIL